jgi:hypothetical protein
MNPAPNPTLAYVNVMFVGSDTDSIKKHLAYCDNSTPNDDFQKVVTINLTEDSSKIGNVVFFIYVRDINKMVNIPSDLEYVVLCFNTDQRTTLEMRSIQLDFVSSKFCYNKLCIVGLGERKTARSSTCADHQNVISKTHVSAQTIFSTDNPLCHIARDRLRKENLCISE